MDLNELEHFGRKLLVALEPVRRLPVNKVMSLFAVAMKEGLTVDDYAKRAGISPTTMSRHLLDLGDIDRGMQPGLGLVTGRTNVTNQREKVYALTPKGRALVTKVAGALR
jgi:DNA-binding MarR family transcriptional regulator